MAPPPLRFGLKKFVSGINCGGLLLRKRFSPLDMRIAFISSRTAREGQDRPPKPAPWPYREKGYTNWAAWIDGTLKRFDDNTKVITVEGPPAIGKSAVARQLAEEFEMFYFPMATMDYWYINHYGFDLRTLDSQLPKAGESCDEKRFRENPHHQNAPLMIFNLLQMKFSQYVDALAHVLNTGQGVVIERCPFTDLAFAEAHQSAGYLLKEELAGYYKMRERVLEGVIRPHLAIYLDASVDTVTKNLKKRGLGEEKTYHKDFLQALEDAYKRKALVEVEKHAELLIYDWNEPGEVETVVEDIERINFERFGEKEEKMKDWRFAEDWDAREKRWEVTHKKELMLVKFNLPLFDCPRLFWDGELALEYEALLENTPTEDYQVGFNPSMGDKVLFKLNQQPCLRLPDYVTDMLLGKPPKPGAGIVN